MNRQEFFRRLEYLLRGIPENERLDALAYYNDYFDDAGVENEQQVILELGSPEAVAQMILEDYHRGQQKTDRNYSDSETMYSDDYRKRNSTNEGYSYQDINRTQMKEMSWRDKIKNMSTSTKILLIIVLVLTFPIWIGVIAGIFGGVVGLLGALFGIVVSIGGSGIGILIGGLFCLIGGIVLLFASPAEGVVTVGIGALMTAISILLILLFVLLAFKWFPTLVKAIVKWAKGLFHHQKGGDEI